jgi:predicted translin family RNA/ssDNA-binding protein
MQIRLREEPSKIMKIFDEYRVSIDRVLFRESQSVMEEFYRSCTNPKASKTSLKNSKSVLELKQKLDQFLYKIEQVTSDISDQKSTNSAFLLLRNRD